MKNLTILFTILCVLLTCGCNKDNKSKTAAEDSTKLNPLELKTSGMDVEKVDINKDGIVDQQIYTKDDVVQYVIRDFNFDGLTDMTEFYEDGVHYRDEIDLDYDGICDLIVTYKDGVPIKKEYSIDFQGNKHGTQYFDSQGNRTEIHRDTNNDGVPDVIDHYKAGEDTPYNTTQISPSDAQ